MGTMHSLRAAALGAAAMLASSSVAAQAPEARVYIPSAASGNIVTWIAKDDHALFLLDRAGRWYRADFGFPCKGISLHRPISIGTDSLGNFDVYSTVRTGDFVCQVRSITRSGDPRKS